LQNKTCACKGGWGGASFLGKKHSKTNGRKHEEINDRINSSIKRDKFVEIS
jgi:hypothetical protein